jgi:hypothetical protein
VILIVRQWVLKDNIKINRLVTIIYNLNNMKKLLFLFSIAVLALGGCKDSVTEMVTYKVNEPVFLSTEAFRSSVKVTNEKRQITNIGKMCFYKDYLYISEPEKGIHIIDNRNPSSPQIVGFIELLGNADLAIRNDRLYADSYIDLVWFDVSNPAQPSLTGRLDSIFPGAFPITNNQYSIDYQKCVDGQKTGIVVGWNMKVKTEEVTHYTGGWWGEKEFAMNDAASYTNAPSTGVNGSMSRFTIYNGNLYSVIRNTMNIFDLTGEQPKKAAENVYLGWNVETIFSYKDNMFMGTPTGLVIYSVADPLKPVYQSSISHVYGCDPVVVDNDLAYVTVHSTGNFCGQNANELEIIDVADVKKPKLLVSYGMKSPKGLGIDNGKLFLCDEGLKVFTITKPETLLANMVVHYSGMDGYDLIPFNNTLMMMADDGIYQYSYSSSNEIKLLSKLPIIHN